MTSTPPGIIFDFDGVIVLSEPVHQRAWIDLAEVAGRELPDGFIESGTGFSDRGLCEILAKHWNLTTEADVDRLLDEKRRAYQRRCVAETEFVPGIKELLDEISGRHPVALATSSSIGDIRPHLHGHKLDRHFKAVLTIESVTNPKPHPEIYQKAAAQLGRAPEQCWVFEDSDHGAAAARAAGARVIAMTTTFPPGAIGPVHANFPNYLDLNAVLNVLAR